MSTYSDSRPASNLLVKRWLSETFPGAVYQSSQDEISRSKISKHKDFHSNAASRHNQSAHPKTFAVSTDTRHDRHRSDHGSKTRNTVASDKERRDSASGNRGPLMLIMKPEFLTDSQSLDVSQKLPTAHTTREVREDSITGDPFAKYDKKKRHKVKPDTYEYKGARQTKKNMHKRKRRDGSMANDNFQAANIDAERVTLKPHCKQFVFSRSKMSLPLPGHDLPDLTFTKVSYLSRPPRTTRPEPRQAPSRQNRKESGVPIDSQESLSCGTAAGTSNGQGKLLKSVSGPTRPARDSTQNEPARELRSSNSITDESHRSTQKPSWARSEVDSRIEEYRLPNTGIQSTTPVSWSTSPLREHCAQAAPKAKQDAEWLSERGRLGSTEKVNEMKGQATRGRSKWSGDSFNGLTESLLNRDVASNAVSTHQSTFKEYQSLEDLKRLSGKTGRGGSMHEGSALQAHASVRGPCISGQKPQSTPFAMHGPTLYTDDVICQRAEFFPAAIQQHQRLENDSSVHQMHKSASKHYLDGHGQDKDWWRVSADALRQQRTFAGLLQGGQQDELTKHDLAYSQLASDSTWAKPARPCWTPSASEHELAHACSNEGQLDDFDLELLKTVKMGRPEQGSRCAGGPRLPYSEGAMWLDTRDRRADLDASVSPVSRPRKTPREQPLKETCDSEKPRVKETGLRLDRPSLRLESAARGFNPFKRSYMLL